MATNLATARGQDTFLLDFIGFVGLSRIRSLPRDHRSRVVSHSVKRKASKSGNDAYFDASNGSFLASGSGNTTKPWF